ncbi:hypothetical protein EsH8_VIII_000111 [Colletotrichum jinshuiense]
MPASARVKVLIIGGSYAGLSAAVNLLDLHQGLQPRQSREPYLHHPDTPQFDLEITIIDERDGYSLVDPIYAQKSWVKFHDIPQLQHPSIKVIHGSISSVDCSHKIATFLDTTKKQSRSQHYDILLTATGLRRVWPVVPQSLSQTDFFREVTSHINSTHNAPYGLAVVGGGAVGVEMAAELKTYHPEVDITLIHSRDKVLSSEPLPDGTKDKALQLLQDLGVKVLMEHRLTRSKVQTRDGCTWYDLEFTNGHKMSTSKVIHAMSRSSPSTSFLPLSAKDTKGFVKVQAKFKELERMPPMMAVAIGKSAVAYAPGIGTTFGEEVAQTYFGDDLALSFCWQTMQLNGREEAEVTK